MISRPLLLFLAISCAACAAAPKGDPGRVGGPPSPPAQEVKWFHSGWYVGATVGSAIADASGSDIDRDLANRGYTTNTSLDATDVGWKIFAGYRFEAPWALELAVVDLGLLESRIDHDATDIDAFLADVNDVHPYAGAGASLSGIYYPIQRERFNLGLKAGLWYWDAEVDTGAATGEAVDIDEDSFDLLVGALGTMDLGGNFVARLEWEHYFLKNNDVDFLALGLQYNVR